MLYFWFFLMPAFTEGYCGDGRTVCPGGGYGHSYDVQRGRSFAEGFSQVYSNQNNGGMGFVLVIVIVALAYFGYKNKDRLGQFSGSRAAVEKAVQDYNLRSDISDKASVTNSSGYCCIYSKPFKTKPTPVEYIGLTTRSLDSELRCSLG